MDQYLTPVLSEGIPKLSPLSLHGMLFSQTCSPTARHPAPNVSTLTLTSNGATPDFPRVGDLFFVVETTLMLTTLFLSHLSTQLDRISVCPEGLRSSQ